MKRKFRTPFLIFLLLALIAVVVIINFQSSKIDEVENVIISTIDLDESDYIVTDGNLSHINDIDGGWSIGNPCGVDNFMDAFIEGDWTLTGPTTVRNAKVTVFGDVIYNGYEITLECDISEVLPGQTLGVDNPTINENTIQLYPNPATTEFFIKGNNLKYLEVFDINARKALGYQINSTISRVPLDRLEGGVYIIRIIRNNGSIETKKLIVE